MDQTPNLALPYILPSQAQKHVTHNEALRALDVLVATLIQSRALSAPPAEPVEGDAFIPAPSASGAWAGLDGDVVAFQDGAWIGYPPRRGWLAFVVDEGAHIYFDGADWTALVGDVAILSRLGVSTTPDDTNRIAVSSPAALFSNAGADARVIVNKAGAADIASVVFQAGFSGRAEFGLTGSDAFALRVSEDGAAWLDALSFDEATGQARIHAGASFGDVADRFVFGGSALTTPGLFVTCNADVTPNATDPGVLIGRDGIGGSVCGVGGLALSSAPGGGAAQAGQVRLGLDGNLAIAGGGWNTGHLVIGAAHLWIDSAGALRMKSSAPTADTDGTVVA